MFNLKIYRQGSEILVAASDHDLIGKEFREGNLHLNVPESFYGSDVADEATMRMHLRVATIGNLVGARVISLARAQGLVEPENVLTIQGVPHAQFALRMG